MMSPAPAGAWRADRRHGKGHMSFRDGSCYEGAWALGERNGLGRMRAPGGDVFVGAFTDGLRMGPGMLLLVCAPSGQALPQDIVNPGVSSAWTYCASP